MTEKEKAKAYDEAIERAKKLYDNGITEEIFPELKEDDTERIRKNCIHFLELQKQHHAATFEIEECIDWLETQGKKSSWKPSKEEMDALYSLSYITNEYDEHKEDVITHLYQDLKREFFNDSSYENMFSLDNKEDDVRRRSTIQVLEYVRSLDAYNQYGKADIDKNIAWLEKQGKNSTDKTKPSFKVGDWIITPKNKVLQITSIDDTSYCDEQCRFWTIEDARDGDILATSAGAFIYNGNNGGGSCPGSYCGINTLGNFQMGVEHHWTGKKVYPATKEERDLLFQKIKEAGYEWDAEKKELKKLDLVPNKKPILEGLNMKTYNDINIGDTVYIWGTSDSSVDETTITEKYDDGGHWNLKFSNGCVGRALKNGTSSTMGMYACLVYSDKEAVRESINKQIKILSNINI